MRMVCRGGETTSDPRPPCLAARPNTPVRSLRRARSPGGARRARSPIAGPRRLRQVDRWARACLLRNSTGDAGQGEGCSSGSPHRRRLARISAAVRQADSISRPRSSSDSRLSASSSSSRNAAFGFDSAPFSKKDDMEHPPGGTVSHVPEYDRPRPIIIVPARSLSSKNGKTDLEPALDVVGVREHTRWEESGTERADSRKAETKRRRERQLSAFRVNPWVAQFRNRKSSSPRRTLFVTILFGAVFVTVVRRMT